MTQLGNLTHGKRENKVGHDAEEAAIGCGVGGWVTDARKSLRHEDAKGIDVVFTTPLGEVPVQIKSSRYGRRLHEAKHQEIVCIVIEPFTRQEIIQERVKGACVRHFRNVGIIPEVLPFGWSIDDVMGALPKESP